MQVNTHTQKNMGIRWMKLEIQVSGGRVRGFITNVRCMGGRKSWKCLFPHTGQQAGPMGSSGMASLGILCSSGRASSSLLVG